MARHQIRAAKPKPEKPKAELRAAPSWYDRTHPVGSAERFLDQAAKEALVAAAAGGLAEPRQLAAGAAKAVAKKASEYPDPLLQRAAELPAAELAKRAARAEAYNQAMKAQNGVVQAMTASMSPAADLARSQASAALATRQAARGGDAGADETPVSETPVSGGQAPSGGPRIVINPTTFTNKKDALCVAFNEGFRLWMEATGFEPQSEPTGAQRRFFSDTAYADDEVQLRRTILARIATFDTSVKDPTDDQLSETGSFLDAILESDWCKNEWERNCVSRLSQAVKASVGAEPVEPRPEPIEPREPEPLQAKADLGGGNTDDEKKEGSEPPQEPSGPENIEQPEEPAPQDAQGGAQEPAGEQGGAQEPAGEQGGAQEPAGAQGAVQPGNEQAQPQNAPQGQEEPSQSKRQSGLQSGVWTGGEEGKGRQLTAREAEWMRQRIESGATVSGQQLAMFGLQRNERGAIVDGEGNAFKGFGGEGEKPLPGAPDAKLDAGRGDRPAATPARKIGDIGATSFTDTKHMNGPSIQPVRPIGTIDTADGSGGSTLRRRERRRSII